MLETKPVRAYRDRRALLVAIGAMLSLAGSAAAIVGPLEMYCFTLLSKGGRFHYPGFGYGSFMFGNIACQIVGYYLIALIFVPLGCGHLRQRPWIRPVSLALLWCWVVLGIPLSLAFLFALFSAKELSISAAGVVIGATAVAYPLMPWLLIRFYESRDVRMTLEGDAGPRHWLNGLPVPTLVVVMLLGFHVVVLHALILFNGLFPLWGRWATGLPGIALIDVTSLCLVGLAWGTISGHRWAWWGSLATIVTMSTSWVTTLAVSTWSDILAAMDFPPYELRLLERVPVEGSHLSVLAGIPLGLTLVAIVRARDYLEKPRAAAA